MHQLGVGVLECWRRGWDSNPERLLETRNLLISRSDQNAGTACTAGVRYKKGTKREHSKRQNRNDTFGWYRGTGQHHACITPLVALGRVNEKILRYL